MSEDLPFISTPSQQGFLSFEQKGILALRGEAGSGKTSLASVWMQNLAQDCQQKDEHILVLTPQKSLASPYLERLAQLKIEARRQIEVLTLNTLVRRMIGLFWPLIAQESGFQFPWNEPRFLTIETAQYYMGRIVDPMLQNNAFASISLPRNRLYSQLLDNLNKSAIIGFPYTQISERLSQAWTGNPEQLKVYADAQEAVNQFRTYCLANNLLDYSLQVQIFSEVIWPNSFCRAYIQSKYQHLIYDNIEEDPPFAHDLILSWLPAFQSALLIQDENAGFRSFLGADPQSAQRLLQRAQKTIVLKDSYQASPNIEALRRSFSSTPPGGLSQIDLHASLRLSEKPQRLFTELLADCAQRISQIHREEDPECSIAILAPTLSDSMCFSLQNQLKQLSLGIDIQHPAGPLYNNPVVRSLMTLSTLAYPVWGIREDNFTIMQCLGNTIRGFNLIYANLITRARPSNEALLPRFENIPPNIQDRFPAELATKYRALITWLEEFKGTDSLDLFISRIFFELLSQPGYGYYENSVANEIICDLLRSYSIFGHAAGQIPADKQALFGLEFYSAIQSGLIPDQARPKTNSFGSGITLSPVSSFIMQNRAVDYQFWLNIGSSSWYQRLEQPLTHPFVLSRNWQAGSKWTMDDETALNRVNLRRTINALLLRCRKAVFAEHSQFNEAGSEEKGLLLYEIQGLYRQSMRDSHA